VHGADASHGAVGAQAMVYQQLQRQSTMLSFVDNFWIMSVICVCVIPLMFLMKRRTSLPGGRVPVH
jgi:DHA2 family multidrug resistance protein